MSQDDMFEDLYDDEFDFIDDIDEGNPETKKKAAKNKRRIDSILEKRRLEEEIGGVEYYLSHRNRHKAHSRDKKRN